MKNDTPGRVARGGAWVNRYIAARATARLDVVRRFRSSGLGLRVVRSSPKTEEKEREGKDNER